MGAFAAYVGAADGVVLAVMGDPIHYDPQVGAEKDIVGVFDSEFRRADSTQPGVAVVGPAVFVRLADLLPIDPARDDQLTAKGSTYRVREVQKGNQGGAVLHLQKVLEVLP